MTGFYANGEVENGAALIAAATPTPEPDPVASTDLSVYAVTIIRAADEFGAATIRADDVIRSGSFV